MTICDFPEPDITKNGFLVFEIFGRYYHMEIFEILGLKNRIFFFHSLKTPKINCPESEF